MSEIKYIPLSACIFRTLQATDLLAQLIVQDARVEGLEVGVRGGGVDGHVEDAEVQLAEVEEGVVDVLDRDDLLDEVLGDLLARLVVGRQGADLARRPAPVLQHLAGRLHEVPHRRRPVEPAVLGPPRQVVDAVAELVEECHDFLVLQQGWLLRRRLGEVADQRRGRVSPRPIFLQVARLQVEVRGVTVLALAGVEVQI